MFNNSKRTTKTKNTRTSLSTRLSGKSIKHNRLSAVHLTLFSLIFAFIGGYAIYKTFAAEAGYSNKSYGVISGTVSNVNGDPIGGSNITVSVSGTKRIYTASSKGQYYIPALPQGSYTIKFSAASYNSNIVTANAEVGKISTKNVRLAGQ